MKNIHRPTDPRIRVALNIIERQFHDPAFRLQNVAERVGLSRCYLSHSIKSATGSGFRDHLRRARIDSAFALLMDPKLSVKEVAAAVGFNRLDAGSDARNRDCRQPFRHVAREVSMFHSRLLRVVVATSLALFPMQLTVERNSDVVFAEQSTYCNVSASATAFEYSSGNPVGGANGGHGAFYDTYSECLSAGQALAIQVAGNACGSYGPGQAYAVVTWDIYWDFQYQGQVNQQYDCGDV